jgi:hypothetical protein
MEVQNCTEMLVTTYKTIRSRNPENGLDLNNYENLGDHNCLALQQVVGERTHQWL